MSDAAPIRRSSVAPADCSLARSIALIGERWSLLLLRSAQYGVRRFDDFQAELGIPRSVLSQRLAQLVAHGLLARRLYREAGRRARAEYALTPMGHDLALPFIALTEWGDRWLGGERVPPMTMHRRRDGRRLHVSLADEAGTEVPLASAELRTAGARGRP